MLHRAFFLIAATLVTGGTAAGQDIDAQPWMQSCTRDSECVLAQSECGNVCETTPINREHLPSFELAFAEECGRSFEGGTCRVQPEISAICQEGRCSIDLAYQETGRSEGDRYGYDQQRTDAFGSQGNDGPADPERGFEINEDEPPLTFSETVEREDNNELFTAYDLERDDVEMGTLGQLRIREDEARRLHREYWQ